MKSMKLASGFAISALAMAIAGTATAETETEFSYNGEVEFNFIADFEDEFNDVRLADAEDEDVGDGEGVYGIELNIDVVHGPFSGSIGLESNNGNNEITVGDLVITDGPISFGQVGSLIETDEYTYDLENATTQDVDAAFRYTLNNLQVQLEGSQTDGDADSNDLGLGAQYSDDIGALSFIVNSQVRMSDAVANAADAAGLDASPFIFAGAGVTYDLDIATVAAAYNFYTTGEIADGVDQNGDSQSEAAVSLTTMPIDALTLGFHFQDENLGEDLGMKYKADFSYNIDAITLSGDFESTEGADEWTNVVSAKIAWAQDLLAAYAEVEQDITTDDANPELGLGASLTQENGVTYAADYTFQDDASNDIVFSAAYSF